jgi:hypothetical protein
MKYRRSFNIYSNNSGRRDDIWQMYGHPLSFYAMTTDEDTNAIPIINVIRSCIETHVSKISQSKTRPLITPQKGTYKDYQIAENAQLFFDTYFDKENIFAKTIEALKDAEIFDMGVTWIDEFEKSIKVVKPWQYFFDYAEYQYKKENFCFIEERDYSIINALDIFGLPEEIGKAIPYYLPAFTDEEGNIRGTYDDVDRNTDSGKLIKGQARIKGSLWSEYQVNPTAKCTHNVFYDLRNCQRIDLINGVEVKRTDLESDANPCTLIWYMPPVKGGQSTSMTDNLFTIQDQINLLAGQIAEAAELSPANFIVLPTGSLGESDGIKASMIENGVATVYEYSAVDGAGPFSVQTPDFISEQRKEMLQYWIQLAYEMEGISQLSAQSKKPSGINSGVGLQTLQDVESERHNVILGAYIKFTEEIAKKIIKVFPEEEDILPARRGMKSVKWKDIKTSDSSYAIQIAPTDWLSTDPMVKMQQIEKMIAMGRITNAYANKLMDIPDLQGAFSIINASYDACQRAIQRAIEDEDYDFSELLNIQELFQETQNVYLRLDSNDEKPEVMDRLVTLLNKIKHQMDQFNSIINPPTPPPNAPPPVALNGPQVESLKQILKDVRDGTLSSQTATALILASFPEVAPAMVDQMVGGNAPQGQQPGLPPPPAPAGNVPAQPPAPTPEQGASTQPTGQAMGGQPSGAQ